MSLPKSIKIGAIHYRVEEIPNLGDDSGKLDGRISHGLARIQIEDDLNPQGKVHTLLHEIVHAVATQLGHPKLDEGLVDAIAYGAYQVLRDNPILVKAIAKPEK